MPRGYSHKFLLHLKNTDVIRLGTRLGRTCVEANLPAAYVARVLQVSKTTIYKWFRGQGVREDKRLAVETLLHLLEEDMQSGKLPVTSIQSAKNYLSELSGVSI